MKKHVGLLLILVISLLFAGCSSAPKGDATQILNAYYQNIKDNKGEAAFNLLSEASKKNFAKDDFIKWVSLVQEMQTFKEVKVEKSNEFTNKEIDGITYKNVVEFNVTETDFDLYQNKDLTQTYTRDVVNDNGEWKIYRGKENGKENNASVLNALAWMYIDGRGKSKDLVQAIIVTKEGLKYDSNYATLYYTLGATYRYLNRNDEALDAINIFLTKETNNENKSDGYNVLGNIYVSKGEIANAKAAFTKALDLNPNNEYAKTNFANLP